MDSTQLSLPGESAVAYFDRALFSEQVILKACYWLSKDFSCEIERSNLDVLKVTLKPRQEASTEALSVARETLIQNVSDFALREQIEAKTAGIRDILLAKAFSEAGVLEDSPMGTFGDKIEEEKPEGMFKILGNARS